MGWEGLKRTNTEGGLPKRVGLGQRVGVFEGGGGRGVDTLMQTMATINLKPMLLDFSSACKQLSVKQFT